MACNCITADRLNELYKIYGTKKKFDKNTRLRVRIKAETYYVLAAIAMVFITPILFIYLCCKTLFGDNKVSLRKFFRLKVNHLAERADVIDSILENERDK